MLIRKFRRDGGAQPDKTVTQDGFSATIDAQVHYAAPRPWHDDEPAAAPVSSSAASRAPAVPEPASAVQAPAAASEPAAAAPAARGA